MVIDGDGRREAARRERERRSWLEEQRRQRLRPEARRVLEWARIVTRGGLLDDAGGAEVVIQRRGDQTLVIDGAGVVRIRSSPRCGGAAHELRTAEDFAARVPSDLLEATAADIESGAVWDTVAREAGRR